MQGMRLPRNMRLKKNDKGELEIVMMKTKRLIPLRCFEKMTSLTPSAVSYLKEYEESLNTVLVEGKKTIADTKTLERIRTILSKPKLDKDLITQKDFGKLEIRYTESHYRRLGFKGYDDWKIQDNERRAKAEQVRKDAEEKKLKEVKDAKPKK